jgi:ABC-type nitrate/sulfonate/bicarbonate transport system substrate-binding protein
MKRLWLAGVAAAIVAQFSTGPASAEPLTIRMQYASISQFVALIPHVPKELYRHYGKSYVVKPTFMRGSGPSLSAFAAGELDLAALTPQSLGNAVLNAKLKITALVEVISADMPGHVRAAFYCQADKVKTVEDLRGKTIGINAHGSSPEAAARAFLGQHGMEMGRDYQAVEMRFNVALPALDAKKVDCAVLVPPWVNFADARKDLRAMFAPGDVFGPTETVFWVGRPDWIAAHRAALVDFAEDHIRMRHWCLDPKTHGEAVKLAAKIGKQSVKAFGFLWTAKDNYHEPNGLLDVARLQKNLDDLNKYGLLPAKVSASEHADISIVREAMARTRTN